MRPFRNANDSSRGRSYPTNDAPLLHNELQNLDMELEILKRQREIIFKQRQVENQLFSQRLNTFNEQTSSTFGHLEPKQSYSSSYSPSYNPSSSRGYKRSNDRNYDPPAPKQSRNDWANTKYKPNKPQPLMNIPTQQYKKAKPFPNKSKAFEPRATNTTPSFRPQKVPPSRTEVNKSGPKTAAPIVKKKFFTADDILRPDVIPSPSMNGRLELALGEILKCIKTSPQLTEDQKKQLLLTGMRNVKSVIRQRIFAVMMNKQVRTKAEIEAMYRKTYKKDVDNEIIEAIETSYVKAGFKKNKPIAIKNISATETERIHKFFKAKINMLLKNKMQSMIDSLLKIYGDNEEEIFECLKDLPELEDKEEEEEPNKDEADVEMNDSTDTANKPEDIVESADTDNTVVENANNATDVEEEKKTSENATIDLTSDENATEKPRETDKEDDMELTNKEDARIKIKQYYRLMDLMIENRLPKLLLKFKDEFANLMYCEKDFIVAKELIMRELKDTLRQSLEAANNINEETNDADKTTNEVSDVPVESTPEGEKEMGNNKILDEIVNTQNLVKPSPQEEKKTQMCVMLLGKPALPAKALIYDFLGNYNPKSIKKHKAVNNLLVVGFENKEDYESILKQNETKVGDATFIIKANEVIASDKHKENTADKADSEVNVSKNTEESKEDKVDETKEIDNETNNDYQGNEKIFDESEEVTEDARENREKPCANGAQTDEEKNDITEKTDKSNEENVDASNEPKVDDVNRETANVEKVVETKNVDIIQETENENKEVNNLETIRETEETDKAKARTRAVATPTRTSSRLANVTPSTIKTRRASRLAQ